MAGLLVAIAVVDFLILHNLGDDEPLIVRTWRLFLTGLLSFFLALGKNAARWVIVVLTALGSLGGFVATAVLVASGGVNADSAWLVAWLVFVTIAYASISSYLSFSTGVAREIRRIAERFPEDI